MMKKTFNLARVALVADSCVLVGCSQTPQVRMEQKPFQVTPQRTQAYVEAALFTLFQAPGGGV